MTEKLTLADCFKYPEAEIVRVYDEYTKNTYRNIIAFIVNHSISVEMRYEISFCKLILRSIEQLTDEEKAQLLENHLNDQGRDILKRSSYSYGNFENRLYELDVKQTDYLRSISVDIDNFLKSGKAVKG